MGQSVAYDLVVTCDDTFDTTPVSSLPLGYRLIVLGYKRVCTVMSTLVFQELMGSDLIDRRMRHCLKPEDGNQVIAGIHFRVEVDCLEINPTLR